MTLVIRLCFFFYFKKTLYYKQVLSGISFMCFLCVAIPAAGATVVSITIIDDNQRPQS